MKKYQQKPDAKQPKIYSIADLMELLTIYGEPPLEVINRPFILNHFIRNGTEESPIYIIISTYGLLANRMRKLKSLLPFNKLTLFTKSLNQIFLIKATQLHMI